MLAFIFYLRFSDRPKTRKFLLSLCLSFFFGCEFNLFFNLNKCRECYGNELCRFFRNGQIQLTCLDCLFSIINPRLTKSVYHGVFNKTKIVVKRKTEKLLSDVENVILCPSVQDRLFLNTNVKKGGLRTNLGISIEPLLLKYFETKPGFSFPKYLGACGDLIVEEYKGQPLSGFVGSDFKTRAGIAVELLKMAQLFTFGHPDYAFYFTDYSFDNLVADTQRKVFLVDLDNVIISKGSQTLTGKIHKSEILDEKNYAFSPSDICSHYLSDHNFFSVCKYLLSHPKNGLLRDIPTDVEERMQILYLLSECTKPEATSDRFSAGRQLQSLLLQVIKGKK